MSSRLYKDVFEYPVDSNRRELKKWAAEVSSRPVPGVPHKILVQNIIQNISEEERVGLTFNRSVKQAVDGRMRDLQMMICRFKQDVINMDKTITDEIQKFNKNLQIYLAECLQNLSLKTKQEQMGGLFLHLCSYDELLKAKIESMNHAYDYLIKCAEAMGFSAPSKILDRYKALTFIFEELVGGLDKRPSGLSVLEESKAHVVKMKEKENLELYNKISDLTRHHRSLVAQNAESELALQSLVSRSTDTEVIVFRIQNSILEIYQKLMDNRGMEYEECTTSDQLIKIEGYMKMLHEIVDHVHDAIMKEVTHPARPPRTVYRQRQSSSLSSGRSSKKEGFKKRMNSKGSQSMRSSHVFSIEPEKEKGGGAQRNILPRGNGDNGQRSRGGSGMSEKGNAKFKEDSIDSTKAGRRSKRYSENVSKDSENFRRDSERFSKDSEYFSKDSENFSEDNQTSEEANELSKTNDEMVKKLKKISKKERDLLRQQSKKFREESEAALASFMSEFSIEDSQTERVRTAQKSISSTKSPRSSDETEALVITKPSENLTGLFNKANVIHEASQEEIKRTSDEIYTGSSESENNSNFLAEKDNFATKNNSNLAVQKDGNFTIQRRKASSFPKKGDNKIDSLQKSVDKKVLNKTGNARKGRRMESPFVGYTVKTKSSLKSDRRCKEVVPQRAHCDRVLNRIITQKNTRSTGKFTETSKSRDHSGVLSSSRYAPNGQVSCFQTIKRFNRLKALQGITTTTVAGHLPKPYIDKPRSVWQNNLRSRERVQENRNNLAENNIMCETPRRRKPDQVNEKRDISNPQSVEATSGQKPQNTSSHLPHGDAHKKTSIREAKLNSPKWKAGTTLPNFVQKGEDKSEITDGQWELSIEGSSLPSLVSEIATCKESHLGRVKISQQRQTERDKNTVSKTAAVNFSRTKMLVRRDTSCVMKASVQNLTDKKQASPLKKGLVMRHDHQQTSKPSLPQLPQPRTGKPVTSQSFPKQGPGSRRVLSEACEVRRRFRKNCMKILAGVNLGSRLLKSTEEAVEE